MTDQTDYEKGYEKGVKDERARCFAICEAWQRPPYIASHYGPYGNYDLTVILKTVKLIQAEIAKTDEPTE